jgi:hypothetical protein
MAKRYLQFDTDEVPLLTKEDKRPKKNDDLVEAKIFSYKLQVEGTLATMVRNGLLSIRIAFLFLMNSSNSPWIGKVLLFVGPTVILWAMVMYIRNLQSIKHLTKTDRNSHEELSSYIWPFLTGIFVVCTYTGAFELAFLYDM